MLENCSRKVLATSLVLVMCLAGATIMYSDDSDADGSFTITDTTGKIFEYSSASDKVVAFGYSATLTVAQSGQVAKLYAVDKYGKEALTDYGYTFSGVDVATCSSSNADSIYTQLVQAKEAGAISLDDTIILTTYSANIQSGGLRDRLETAGFTHVLFYGTMVDYDAVVDCVRGICLACGGTDLGIPMENTKNTVIQRLTENGNPKTDAIFIWYTPSSGWGYGNTGSISVALMNQAGANNIAYNSDSAAAVVYDKSTIQTLLGLCKDAVIFLDSGYIRSYGGSVESFVDEVMGGDYGDHKIVVVERTWNNYDAEAADGLWAMASVLHSDLFDGEVTVYTGGKNDSDNSLLIYGCIVAAIIIVGVVALIFVRSRH